MYSFDARHCITLGSLNKHYDVNVGCVNKMFKHYDVIVHRHYDLKISICVFT